MVDGTTPKPFVRHVLLCSSGGYPFKKLCSVAFQGNFAEAASMAARAMKMWETVLGPEHPHVASALLNEAALLRELVSTLRAESFDNLCECDIS